MNDKEDLGKDTFEPEIRFEGLLLFQTVVQVWANTA